MTISNPMIEAVGTTLEPFPRPTPSNTHFWHGVHFYDDESSLEVTACDFLSDGLRSGDAVVVIATQAHQETFAKTLQALNWDLPGARARGQYLTMNAAETMAKFLVDGWPNPERFQNTIEGVIRRIDSAGRGRVRVFGEMVSMLWETEQQAAAIRTEELWNELARIYEFRLLCAYSKASFRDDVQSQAFLSVCGTHSCVLPPGNVLSSGGPR